MKALKTTLLGILVLSIFACAACSLTEGAQKGIIQGFQNSMNEMIYQPVKFFVAEFLAGLNPA